MEYYAGILFSHQLRPHITVTIRQRQNMDIHGNVSIVAYNSKGKPRWFEIELNRYDDEEQKMITLAHEMFHIKQYVRGEINETLTMWKGKKVDTDKIPYLKQPWEKEAFVGSELLYLSYKIIKEYE